MFTLILLTLFAGLCISATNQSTLRMEMTPSTISSTSPTTLPRNLTDETDMGFSEWAGSPASGLSARGSRDPTCHKVSVYCVNKWNCKRAWQYWEDDWWICQYTSRAYRHCDARIRCGGWDRGDNTCIRGSLAKKLLRDIDRVEGCGRWNCGQYHIPPEEVGGLHDCAAEFEYCINCRDRNIDPPWADLPSGLIRREVDGNVSVSES